MKPPPDEDEMLHEFRLRVGQRVRMLREQKELTQAALAGDADVSRPAVTLLEQGLREPKIGTLIRISRALDVSVMELLIPVMRSMERMLVLVTLITVT